MSHCTSLWFPRYLFRVQVGLNLIQDHSGRVFQRKGTAAVTLKDVISNKEVSQLNLEVDEVLSNEILKFSSCTQSFHWDELHPFALSRWLQQQ